MSPLLSTYWYRSGCRAAALASAAPRPLGSLFGSFSPRGARSKGDQQPDGRVAHNQRLQNIFGVDIGILATRALRAKKTLNRSSIPIPSALPILNHALMLPLWVSLPLPRAWGAVEASSCQARSVSGKEIRFSEALEARLGWGVDARGSS